MEQISPQPFRLTQAISTIKGVQSGLTLSLSQRYKGRPPIFSEGARQTPQGSVLRPPPTRTDGDARTPLGVTQVSATPLFFLFSFFFIILTKYWDVESKKLDAYEILEEGRPFGIQKS